MPSAPEHTYETLRRGIPVLDHGYVKLVDSMGSDEFIVECARMSTGKGFEDWDPHKGCKCCGLMFDRWQHHDDGYAELVCTNGQKEHEWVDKPGDTKVLDFMYRHKHATPFEFGQLVVEVQAPIMVFREWHRHRTQSYSEMSARYTQMPDLHYLPAPERVQKQSTSNKQGSGEALKPEEAADVIDIFRGEQAAIYGIYEAFVRRGLAKEIARLDTPVSRYSRMRASADLRCWLAFLLLRKAPNAQWEIRQYADAVGEIIATLWPRTWALFEEYDLHGVTLSRTEARQIRELLGFLQAETFPEVPELSQSSVLALMRRLQGTS